MKGNMRRKDKAMNETEAIELLERCEVGRLGTCSGSTPYITPINYVYHNGYIYFHCALTGHKITNIKENDNVCFEVDEMLSIIKDENPCEMSTGYRSVIVFGKAVIIDDEDERFEALKKIVDKYSDDKSVSSRLKKDSMGSILIVKIIPEVMTGKKSPK